MGLFTKRPKPRPRRLSSVSSDGGLSNASDDSPTPLPKGQLFILCLMRLTEPVAFFLVFPFIPAMIRELGVAKTDKEVGYWAGLVESLFALTQFLTVLQWGRLSDRIGRVPVLLIGMTGSAMSIFCFGLSKTFTGIILSRCLNGALNGNVAVIKSMIGELSDDTNSARAYSFLPLMAAIGSTIGPLLGGYLSHPAEQYPSIFGQFQFLIDYPYALPCICATALTMVGAVLGFFFLEETLVFAKDEDIIKDGDPQAREPLLADGPPSSPISERMMHIPEPEPKGPTPVRELLSRQMCLNILSYMFLVMESTAYLALLPVFSWTPIDIGGIAFTQREIATAFAIRGIVAIFLQTVVFPPLCNRLGPARTFRSLVVLYIPLWLCFPGMNLVAKTGDHAGVWTLMLGSLLAWSGANMSFAANMILVTSMAPTRADLGTLHGLTQSSVSLTRSFAPFSATALFALTIQKQWLHGYFVYAVFFVSALLMMVASWNLKEGHPAWRHHEKPARPKKARRASNL